MANFIAKAVRFLFYLIMAKAFIHLLMGMNVRDRLNLPKKGPAILAANHNSHMDTLLLIALFPILRMSNVRPVAAADYWMSNPLISWFSQKIVGIVPVMRTHSKGEDPLSSCYQALDEGSILIFFPEGSRGEPGKLGNFKAGIARIAERYPHVPVIPIYIRDTDKTFPRGVFLPVPVICTVLVGKAIHWQRTRSDFMQRFRAQIDELAAAAE